MKVEVCDRGETHNYMDHDYHNTSRGILTGVTVVPPDF